MNINTQNVEKFRFFAHKIIPLVYDESLSYYEFLCKVMKKLNEVIDSLDIQNKILGDFENEITDWENETDEKYNQFISTTDEKYNQFIRNIEVLFNAFKEGEIEARNAFMDALIGNYNTEIHYVVGEYVRYNNLVYKCINNTSGGEWNSADWTEVIYANDLSERQNEFELEMQTEWENFFNNYLQTLGITQTTGQSTTDAMSQKIVSDSLMVFVKKLGTKITERTSAGYYKIIPELKTDKKYGFILSVNSSGTYTIQTATSSSASAIVDDVGNFTVSANTECLIYPYSPTVNLSRIRLSDDSVEWSIIIYEISDILSDLLNKFYENELEKVLSTSESSGYYKNVSTPFVALEKYFIGITVNNSGNYTVQAGTGQSVQSMVDTIVTDEYMEANKEKIFEYIPSVDTDVLRISVDNIMWKANIYKSIKYYSINAYNNTLKSIKSSNIVINDSTGITDCNNLPINSIVSVTENKRLSNSPDSIKIIGNGGTPTAYYATFLTYASQNTEHPSLVSQICTYYLDETDARDVNYDTINPRIATRSARYIDGAYKWSNWSELSKCETLHSSNRVLAIAHQNQWDFDDFNNAPPNAMYQVDLDTGTQILNNPSPGHSGMLTTFAFSPFTLHARVQMYFALESSNAQMYIRYSYLVGSTLHWTNWQKVNVTTQE